VKYDNSDCNQFVSDMKRAGFAVRHYEGRAFWTGPAVSTRDFGEAEDLIRATKVRLQRDQLGLGHIYYPMQSGKLIEE